jgi:transposase
VSTEIEALALQGDSRQRLITVPGVGPIISSAMVAANCNGAGFKQGRGFSAWLVPRQESTGDRTVLGKIQTWQQIHENTVRAGRTRRSGAAVEHSNARSVALDREGIEAAHRNMLAIALANKLARIAWAVLARGQAYQPRTAANAA